MHVDILECYPLCFIKDMGKYEKFTRRKCTAGIYSATIGSDGQVRPCSHSNRVYGSILTEDMVTIFARMSEWKTGELLPRKCLKCTFLKKCSGGCRCEAEYAGNIKNLDPYASDPSSIIPFLEINQIEIDIDPMTKILVKLDLKFRKEDFGYLIWKNNNVTMVDEEAGILLKKMQQTEMTLVDAATISCSKPEDVTAMIKDLITQNFIRLDQTT
jgi:radical SAM protein with 4Fe4S-binding SPASM domain